MSAHTAQQAAEYFARKVEVIGRGSLSVHDRITLGSVQAFLERIATDDLSIFADAPSPAETREGREAELQSRYVEGIRFAADIAATFEGAESVAPALRLMADKLAIAASPAAVPLPEETERTMSELPKTPGSVIYWLGSFAHLREDGRWVDDNGDSAKPKMIRRYTYPDLYVVWDAHSWTPPAPSLPGEQPGGQET